MIPHILAAGPEAVAAGFGAAVAMVVLGIFVLRWYRMRQEFALLRLALEKGISPPMNPALPQWLLSLRQGAVIAAFGAALVILGWIGWTLGSQVGRRSAFADEAILATTVPAVMPEIAPLAPPDDRPRDEGRRGGRGPDPRGPRDDRPPRPRDVAMEAYDRAQSQIYISMAMVGGGSILILLGIVRISFVPAERRYATILSK